MTSHRCRLRVDSKVCMHIRGWLTGREAVQNQLWSPVKAIRFDRCAYMCTHTQHKRGTGGVQAGARDKFCYGTVRT